MECPYSSSGAWLNRGRCLALSASVVSPRLSSGSLSGCFRLQLFPRSGLLVGPVGLSRCERRASVRPGVCVLLRVCSLPVLVVSFLCVRYHPLILVRPERIMVTSVFAVLYRPVRAVSSSQHLFVQSVSWVRVYPLYCIVLRVRYRLLSTCSSRAYHGSSLRCIVLCCARYVFSIVARPERIVVTSFSYEQSVSCFSLVLRPYGVHRLLCPRVSAPLLLA